MKLGKKWKSRIFEKIRTKSQAQFLIKFKSALKINGRNSSGIRREAGFKMLENLIFFKNELKSNFEKGSQNTAKLGVFQSSAKHKSTENVKTHWKYTKLYF